MRSEQTGARVTIRAAVRDFRPAVMRSLPSVEFAPLHESGSATEGFFDIELVGLLSEPGRVRAEFTPTDGSLLAQREAREMTFTVSLGRFGDAEREKQLVTRIAREALTLGKAGQPAR